MPTRDATIQCNLACMYVKIFTERDINFFRVVTVILLKREVQQYFLLIVWGLDTSYM